MKWSFRKILLPLAVATVVGIAVPIVSAQAGTGSASSGIERLPAGFAEHKVRVGDVGINYVRGGHGPTLVLLHGYPQTWYSWHEILPALSRHYTVIAADLRGAGRSDAPATGYDKKTMAADIHGLLVKLGLDRQIRLVGHDIGTMVAYSYAAEHPQDVVKLVLSEAPIPDPSLYEFPSLTANGPGAWHFGFFNLANGLPEELIAGKEAMWINRFTDALEVQKGAVTSEDIRVYAHYLSDPAHLRASLAWFRALPEDIKNDAVYGRTKLAMPVLAIGAQGSLGDFVPTQVRKYATNVTGAVIPASGHWIYEEQPAQLTDLLLRFLKQDR
jgi:pimeloyl-ACP methyl ester carboxylesterase